MAKSLHHGSARYKSLAKELVHRSLGFKEDDENFEKSFNFVLSNLLYHHCLDVNSHSVDRSVQGLAFKMDIHGHQNKAQKLLTLSKEFLSSECIEDVDVKWSILSLLVSLAEQPAKDALSISDTESISTELNDEQSIETDWVKELMEKSLPIPDKDETLSEWSEDDEIKRSIMGCDFDDIITSAAGAKFGDSDYIEKFNISTKNSHLAKSWIENTIQPNYWGSKDRSMKDYYFSTKVNHTSDPHSSDISEFIIMRECLWILLCPIQGFIFTTDQNNQFQVKEVSLSSLSTGSVLKLLQQFASAADQLRTLDQWLESMHCTNKQASCGFGTFQAYSDGLRKWRHSFNIQIVELEKQIMAQESHATLIWLLNKLESSLQNLSAIHKIHSEILLNFSEENADIISLKLINALIVNINSYISLQNRECLLALLRYSLRYYFRLLQRLLWDRDVSPASLKLFGIMCLKNGSQETGKYSEKKFICDNSTINHLEGMSFVISIRQSLIKICELKDMTGKLQISLETEYVNIEEQLDREIKNAFMFSSSSNTDCITSSSENLRILGNPVKLGSLSPSITYSDPYLEMAFEFDNYYSNLEQEIEREFISTKMVRSANLEAVLTKSLVPIVEERYLQLSTGLLKLLKEKHNLQLQLSVLKAVTLMEDGDAMREFYSYLFRKVDDKESVDGASLTQHIQYCIGVPYPTFAEHFSISINCLEDVNKHRISDKYFSTLLSSMSIHYESIWPISLVFTDAVIEKYSKLFIFCLMLKRAIFTLERLHFKEIASFAACYSNNLVLEDGSFSADETVSSTSKTEGAEEQYPLPHRQHRLQLLRQWLIYLTGNLHDHFYTAILMPLSSNVNSLLQEEKHFESFVKNHLLLLNEACRQCLLKDNSLSPVQTALTKVFSTVESVKLLWRGPPDNITNKQLVELEEQYATCHRFMSNFFSTLSRTHASPHVDAFAETLSFSCPA